MITLALLAVAPVALFGLLLAAAAFGLFFVVSGGGGGLSLPPGSTDRPPTNKPNVASSPGSTPTGGAVPSGEPPAAVPNEIAQGGVAMPPGWEAYAWYSYRGQWIRVDLGPRPPNDPQRRVASNLPSGSFAMHYEKFFRPWRWSVMAGDSPTPLGTALVQGPFETSSWGDYPDEQASLDEISDLVARLAGDWVDTVLT